MQSYESAYWSGTVKFTCLSCNEHKIYKARNEKEYESAENTWRKEHKCK